MSTFQTTLCGIYPKLIEHPAVPHLKRSLHAFDNKEISEDQLEEVIRKNSAQILAEQKAAGITVPADGLIRWEDFYSPFCNSWQGIYRDTLKRIYNTNTLQRHPRVASRINFIPSSASEDAAFILKSSDTLKATLPGPFTFASDCEDDFYHDFEKLLGDITSALNKELKAYEKAGVPYVEIYEPALHFNDFNRDIITKTYSSLLSDLTNLKVIIGSFYGTVKKTALDIIGNLNIAGFSLDLVKNPESTDWIEKAPPIIQLGILDARTTAADDLTKAKTQIKAVADRFSNSEIWLSLNNSTEFLPRDRAQNKLAALTHLLTSL